MTEPVHHNVDGKEDMRNYTKFRAKLTPDAKQYSAGRMACGIPAVDIVREIKLKYDIDISPARIGALVNTNKKVKEYYDICRKQFLEESAKHITDVAIGVQEERIKDAQSIRNRLFKMMSTLERRIDDQKSTLEMHRTYMTSIVQSFLDGKKMTEDQATRLISKCIEGSQLHDIHLMKELRETIETHLKVLKFASDDTRTIVGDLRKQAQPSLIQHVENQVLQINPTNKSITNKEGY